MLNSFTESFMKYMIESYDEEVKESPYELELLSLEKIADTMSLEEVVKRRFSKKRGSLGDRVNNVLVSISEKIKDAIGTAALATVLTSSSLLMLVGYDAALSNKMGVEPETNRIVRSIEDLFKDKTEEEIKTVATGETQATEVVEKAQATKVVKEPKADEQEETKADITDVSEEELSEGVEPEKEKDEETPDLLDEETKELSEKVAELGEGIEKINDSGAEVTKEELEAALEQANELEAQVKEEIKKTEHKVQGNIKAIKNEQFKNFWCGVSDGWNN